MHLKKDIRRKKELSVVCVVNLFITAVKNCVKAEEM